MVDNRDRAAVQLHHEHVLHPRPDLYSTLPSVKITAAAKADWSVRVKDLLVRLPALVSLMK